MCACAARADDHIYRHLVAEGLDIRLAGPGDYGWILHAHGQLYSGTYGFNDAFEALVAQVLADYLSNHDPAREATWIASAGGRPVGSVMCSARTTTRAQLRLLLVWPSEQRSGIGSSLIETCVEFATRAGYTGLELWTNEILIEARRLYIKHGFKLASAERHQMFGPSMVGETWLKTLV